MIIPHRRAPARAVATILVVALLACLLCAPIAEALTATVTFTQSQIWRAPRTATNFRVTLSGGGGGSATSYDCTAGGGSGAAIHERQVDTSQWTDFCTEDVRWNVEVGAGGAPGTVLGGNGGASAIVAVSPNGTELFRAVAYGGGGGQTSPACCGGGGGGAASSASNAVPGAGNPTGRDGCMLEPLPGLSVGDTCAGGAGHHVLRSTPPSVMTASRWQMWRFFFGGRSMWNPLCIAAGGAAGLGGVGASGDDPFEGYWPFVDADAQSGAGGGTVQYCDDGPQPPLRGWGGSGNVTVTYDYTVAPSPSPSPLASNFTANLKAAPNLKWLTAYAAGGVNATASTAGSAQTFRFVRQSTGLWSIMSVAHNKYLTVGSAGAVTTDATAAGPWELFRVRIDSAKRDTWYITCHLGTHVAAQDTGAVVTTDRVYAWLVTVL
jgi:hypothetical protein